MTKDNYYGCIKKCGEPGCTCDYANGFVRNYDGRCIDKVDC
uniref:TIL domain-containing protein n=1 Tax=Rhabditophanes sp. KR3021 TaxID=114890 RepID=A0AC35TTS1_9BILA